MFGALAKTYYAQKKGLDPAKIVSVSIMPCTAKKFEANRPEMRASGFQDVDYVLTTRELAIMIGRQELSFWRYPILLTIVSWTIYRSRCNFRGNRRSHGSCVAYGL
jgi:iron only hydrogenase large subunit-like protein